MLSTPTVFLRAILVTLFSSNLLRLLSNSRIIGNEFKRHKKYYLGPKFCISDSQVSPGAAPDASPSQLQVGSQVQDHRQDMKLELKNCGRPGNLLLTLEITQIINMETYVRLISGAKVHESGFLSILSHFGISVTLSSFVILMSIHASS